ncbi:MAG: hypothetical protein ACTHLD_14705 [Chitinophaga sp.]
MKRNSILTLACLLLSMVSATAQVTGTISIGGDIDKYYPVTFYDQAYFANVATDLQIGRSDVHRDSSWRGSIIARFRFHVSAWGNGSSFIDADIRQENNHNPGLGSFVAAWRDASVGSLLHRIIIWLRGNTTYSYISNYAVNPIVYDGVQNALPLLEPNGPSHSYRTVVGSNVNQQGISLSKTMNINASGTNVMYGNLGIGTYNTGPYRLAVEGTIGARKVKVTSATPWADFVFEKDYQLPSLKELEDFVSRNKHLPGIPTAAEVGENGVELGDISAKLLQKIEEQALYIIDLNKKLDTLTKRLAQLEK